MSKANEQFEQLNQEEQNLFKMRHSSEHVLMMAMRKFFPQMKMAMGPATTDGFYFDVDLGSEKISEEDFPKLEKEMYRIINQGLKFIEKEITILEAKKLFQDNEYKQEWINEIESKGEKATTYWTGEGTKDEFVDLCSGPHVEDTKEIGAIKLLSVAGAYWRGNEKNKMLTRIYGTAFPTKEELKQYLWRIDEAKKRDHKKLGVELDLFTFSELVGSGLPLWTPRGTLIRELLDGLIQQLRKEKGYNKVEIPHITKKDLYITSGHWNKFSEELFKITTREGHEFAMKPMNCPHHTQIYGYKKRSYREVPQRYANTTMVYRDEQTGELSGLSRVRCITQDDAHVFCRESQVESEVYAIWDIVEAFYKATGFPNLSIRLSLHDPNHFEKYLGTSEQWQFAENQLRTFLKKRGAKFHEALGEAAFYGPKIDFIGKDSLGREWQVATIQVDRNMPERFDLSCINEKGGDERIVMIHAAIMGAIERFLSILIEHFVGAFPLWLSPVQVSVVPISEKSHAYALGVFNHLKEEDIRVELSDGDASMQKRIREAEKQKIPYMLVVGEKEAESKHVAVRQRGRKDLGLMNLETFSNRIKKEVADKMVW